MEASITKNKKLAAFLAGCFPTGYDVLVKLIPFETDIGLHLFTAKFIPLKCCTESTLTS